MVRIKNRIAAPILTTLAFGAAMFVMPNQAAIAASEQTIERDVSGFESIRLMGSFEGTVEVGNTESLTIIGKGDLDEKVVSEVKGDELRIKVQGRKIKGVRLEINAKMLDAFIIEGAGDFKLTGIDSEEFDVSLPGAAKLSIEGKCGDLSIRVAGAAHVDAKDLVCKTGKVRISGTGTISVHTDDSIDARVSGLGKISVYGDPDEIDQHISGLGKIKLH